MFLQPSILSLIAAGFYLFVVAGCLAAGMTAYRERADHWHLRAWLALTIFFAGLMILRVLNLEDVIRSEIRNLAKGLSVYEDRQTVQTMLMAIIASFGCVLAVFAGRWHLKTIRTRAAVALCMALYAAVGMILLIALRLVSLHAIDVLLYDFKFNWILDLGLSLIVGGSSVLYITALCRPRPRSKVDRDNLK